MMIRISTLSIATLMAHIAAAAYQPCPLLGPFHPPARIDSSSPVVQKALSSFTKELDDYVQAGDGDYGPITPNTTSFSITLFSGSTSDVSSNQSNPFFYEYHHTAPATAEAFGKADADSSYPVGALTQLFTVYALLVEAGSEVWHKPITDFLPELRDYASNSSTADSLTRVKWDEVTLGALASHMSGIGRDSQACNLYKPCQRNDFLQSFAAQPPLYLPDTTPAFSNAAFQLLAFALETLTGQPFEQSVRANILDPLNLTRTAFLGEATDAPAGGTLFGDHGLVIDDDDPPGGEPAALGLRSSARDLSRAGRAMLASQLLPAATTRRWLKPVTSTSNLRNAVGRPWEIYHFGLKATDPVVDVYTKTSDGIGRYASYFGLAPDHDVGFVILAHDNEEEEEEEEAVSPDLNAYADVTLGALLAVDRLGREQARASLAGTYRGARGNASLVVNATGDAADPGLSVERLVVDGMDWRAWVARLSGIEQAADLDFRLYPTNLREPEAEADGGGMRQEFRAVFQDKSAPVDQGTPTCITWMSVDGLKRDGKALDSFVFHLDRKGNSTSITIPALDAEFQRS